jgi:hypothetical protein
MESSFDERRFGFGGILDLLRACQREGIFRLERDRQGVLRVFPGAVLQRPVGESQPEVPPGTEPAIVPDVVGEPESASVVVEAEVLAASVDEPGAGGASVGTIAAEQPGEAPTEQAGTKPRRRRAAAGTRKTAGTPKKPKTTRTRARAR